MGATRTGARGVTPWCPAAGLGAPKTASVARFSRRFREKSRLSSRIAQNGGKRFVTRASRVISVRSTGLAESCLTSQIGRDGVYSGSYERIMYIRNFTTSQCHRGIFRGARSGRLQLTPCSSERSLPYPDNLGREMVAVTTRWGIEGFGNFWRPSQGSCPRSTPRERSNQCPDSHVHNRVRNDRPRPP